MSIHRIGPTQPGDSHKNQPETFKMKTPNVEDLKLSEGIRGNLKKVLSDVGEKVPLPLRTYYPGGSKVLAMLVKRMNGLGDE